MNRRISFLCLILAACLPLTACGSRTGPTVALALDGPPLYIAGEYKNQPVRGSLDRTAMAGVGKIALTGAGAENAHLSCQGEFNAPPTEKGRVPGFMDCGKDGLLAVMLRNLGPDQGVGLGHAENPEEMLIFFYHSSEEEARRRLPGVVKDIRTAREGRKARRTGS